MNPHDESPSIPPVTDWQTDFDPFDPDFVADPYPVLKDLREGCRFARSDRYHGLTAFTTFADVDEVAHRVDDFSSRRNILNSVPTDKRALVLPPINFDPPLHTEYRRLLLPFFNPNRIAAWEGPVREICGRLLDGLEGRTEIEAAGEYAQEIPGEVTAMMLGVPVTEGARFRDWIHTIMEVGPNDYTSGKRATEEVKAYMADLLRDRRGRAGHGLATGSTGAEGTATDGTATDGTATETVVDYVLGLRLEGAPLPEDELVNTLFLLMLAGIDTTWSAIGFCLVHLAGHPEDRRRLVTEPGLVTTAVEEFLRMYSPVWVARVAEHDTEVAGCPVGKGEWAVIDFRSANRDADAFERADEFVIDRERNRHTAFGLGVHRCLGSNLARLEMAIAVEMWMERFPEFTLADPSAVTYSAGAVRGPRRIPLRIGTNT